MRVIGIRHRRILLLDEGAPGQPLGTVLALDTVLDLDVTTNRPDCLCHVGVARELAAALADTLEEIHGRRHLHNRFMNQLVGEPVLQIAGNGVPLGPRNAGEQTAVKGVAEGA